MREEPLLVLEGVAVVFGHLQFLIVVELVVTLGLPTLKQIVGNVGDMRPS